MLDVPAVVNATLLLVYSFYPGTSWVEPWSRVPTSKNINYNFINICRIDLELFFGVKNKIIF
jgi:hypothetical protein